MHVLEGCSCVSWSGVHACSGEYVSPGVVFMHVLESICKSWRGVHA